MSGRGGISEVGVIPVVFSVARAFGSSGVQGCKPDALDRAGVAEVFQHLVDKELAFPVRVARVDDRSGLTEQIADYLKLKGAGRSDSIQLSAKGGYQIQR